MIPYPPTADHEITKSRSPEMHAVVVFFMSSCFRVFVFFVSS